MIDLIDIFSWQFFAFVLVVCIARTWLKGKQYKGPEKLKGKVALITGANCGIGKQITRLLNERGAKVYTACRFIEKGQQALAELAKCGCSLDRLSLFEIDLSSLESVRHAVKMFQEKENKLDILVNNAGVMLFPKYKMTEDGHELTWQTNYLGHFLLTELLMPCLKEVKGEARIVNVSALAHYSVSSLDLESIDRREGWDSREAYSRSKLAQVMHAIYLSKLLRLEGSSVTINACHPGLCYTRIARYTPFITSKIVNLLLSPLAWFFLKTPKDGAQCPLHCAVASQMDGVSGKYVSECKVSEPSEVAKDERLCKQLYEYSKNACGLDQK